MSRRPNIERDQKIADYMSKYLEAHGYLPTHRQIQKSLRIDHLFTVQRSLARLKATQESPPRRPYEISLVGFVAAGIPIEAIENHEPVEVPPWMIKKGHTYFILKVKGNSMIEDGIFNEDLVLIRKQESAKNGDTVVALINNEATLKRFYKKADQITLMPANYELRPIQIQKNQDFRIAGICAGVLRRLDT